jgi:hypothetical protein
MRLFFLFLVFNIGVLFSQSKKEQIEILTNRIDSLNLVIGSERISNSTKLNEQITTINALESQISSLNINISKLSYELKESKSDNLVKQKELDLRQQEIIKLQTELMMKSDSLVTLRLKFQNTTNSSFNEDLTNEQSISDLEPAIDNNTIPKNILKNTEDCSDCFWYNFDDYELGELLFIHNPKDNKLFFKLNGKEFYIPLLMREFEDFKTSTGSPSGTGNLIFENQEIKLIYNFSQAGHSMGSEGEVAIFKNGIKIKQIYIRSTGY